MRALDAVLCWIGESLLLLLICMLFAVRDATCWTRKELERALQRWHRVTHEGTQQRPSRRLRPRTRPRHYRLAWLLWHQLRRRLARRQQHRHRRRLLNQTESVWCTGGGGRSGWPLSLTSDYHSDGRDTPATSSARSGPLPSGEASLLSGGATGGELTSLSSAYSWDAEPSPRSLPSSRTEDSPARVTERSNNNNIKTRSRSRCDLRSDAASSASWSSVHESDCECSLLQQISAKPSLRNTVPKVGGGGGGCGGGSSRRRSVPDKAIRRRQTWSQRDRRRWSEERWGRRRQSVWARDGYRSTDDDMEPDRGRFPGSAAGAAHQLKTPMSFSMSSLHQAGYHTPETTTLRLRADRPYNSLCRKRKERPPSDPGNRQSWGSEVSKEAFWEALQPSYAFLMEHQLIESCKEASGDLTWDATDVPGIDSGWSFCEFLDQYTELYEWLSQIQGVIYSSPKNITDRQLRESHMEEIQRKAYRRKLLVEQSGRLQARQPDLRDEVSWRLAHLSNKWDTLLQCVRPPSPSAVTELDMADIGPDIAHEVRCLEQWFRHMDGQLGPISFRIDLRSTQEAADRLKQYQALHDEIKSHHRIVSGVGRLCRQLAEEGAAAAAAAGGGGGEQRGDRRRLERLATRLDTSWQQIFLRAYEWCCHLEGLLEEFKQGRLPRVEDGYSADEDEREPLSKVRRLASCDDPQSAHSDAGSFFEDDYLLTASAMKVLRAPSCSSPASPSKKVEREILDIGYSSENSGQSSDSNESVQNDAQNNDETSTGVRRSEVNTSNVRCEVINAAALNGDTSASSDEETHHPTGADVGASFPSSSIDGSAGGAGVAAGTAPTTDTSEPFSASQRSAENCATFYFRHADTDTEEPRRRAINASTRASGRYSASNSDLEEYLSPAWPESDSDWLNNSGLDESDLEAIGFATAQEILSELGELDNTAASPEADAAAAAGSGSEERQDHPGAPGGESSRPTMAAPCESEIHRLVERAESLVRADLRRSLPPLELDRQVKAKGRRVREWLRRQHGRRNQEPAQVTGAAQTQVDVSGQVTDSSCDASGEYTSESELDTASSVSEDLTCSMVTCHELATPTGLAPPTGSPDAVTPKVVMRSKKRRSGERPWSLHGLNSGSRLRSAPLSVSETALNEMLTPTNEKGVTSSSSNTTVSAGAVPKKLPNSASFDSPFWAGRRRSRVYRPTTHSSGSEAGGGATGGSPGHRRRRSLRLSGSDGERGRLSLSAADAHRSSLLSCTTEATLVEVVTPRTMSEVSPRDGAEAGQGTEEVSSISEQSWDPYQELKEVTEIGSEGSVDRDAVLRLLDCDDYRKYIDSHSDCASSAVSSARGNPRSPFKRNRRKPRALSDSLDSDSDGDELQNILEESRANLTVVQAELERRAADSDAIYSGILATCRSELNRLEQVRILVDPLGLGRDPDSPCYKPEVNEVAGVIQKWESLRASAMEQQTSADALAALRERMRSFRHALVGLDERASRASHQVANVDDLQARISAIKALQEELADRRQELVTVNTDVHSWVSNGGGDLSVKDDVATLYRIWDEVNHRARGQLEHLNSLHQTWVSFVAARAELSQVLQADKQKLNLLQEALRTGGDVSSRVQDVARVLTDRGRTQTTPNAADVAQGAYISDPVTGGVDELSEGTSGYDSATSDDLSERERRLGRLKRMARDLEVIVSPASAAWSDISHTLTSAQSELRELQQTCRDLVIQTTEEFQPDGTPAESGHPLRGKNSSTPEWVAGGGAGVPGSSSSSSSGGRRGWLWRVLRAALPFQLALILCFCVACLLEPHCCDNLNNLSMSLTPQLRYVRGPPPI